MKRFLLMITASIFILSACSEDDEATTYEQAAFYGTWELSNSTSTDYAECPDNPPVLGVNATEISFPTTSNGCNSGSTELSYTFNGSTFSTSFFGIAVDYKIISQTENEFTWENDFEGAQETYVKVD
jgi:hypothetical protein